jgi:hypothetical protein
MRSAYLIGFLLWITAVAAGQDRRVIEDLSESTFERVHAERLAREAAGHGPVGSLNGPIIAQQLPKETAPTSAPPDDPASQKNRQTPRQPEPVKLVMLSRDNWTPLTKTQKFNLVWQDLISPGTHLGLAGASWLSWTTNDQTYMGPGFKGWAKRYGYSVADEASGVFFGAYVLPVIFKQDPRYLPMDHGRKRDRIVYAMSRVIITRADDGGEMFNVSKVGGTIITSALSNAYYPDGRDNSTSAAFQRAGFSLLSDAGYNIFVEFWPDFARKLHLGKFFQQLVRRSVRVSTSKY